MTFKNDTSVNCEYRINQVRFDVLCSYALHHVSVSQSHSHNSRFNFMSSECIEKRNDSRTDDERCI